MEQNILAENRSRGWERVSELAPAFVKRYIAEFRTAALENRSMSQSFIQGHVSGVEVRSRARISNAPKLTAGAVVDAYNRARLREFAVQIANDAARIR
jgi:hypothetical protein